MNPFWNFHQPLHAVPITQSRLLDLLNEMHIRSAPGSPDVVLCGLPQAAAIRATVDFQGRDPRRIKREINKAMRRARKDRR